METIYSIPINNAYSKVCGCPVCALERQLETDSLEYVLGAAMMEPDVRTETNKHGFCADHFAKMLTMQKRLPLSLILESYLNDLLKLMTVENPDKRKLASISASLSQAVDGCFVCSRIAERMEKYYSNIIYLWSHDDEFRIKMRKQTYFCPRHIAALLHVSQSELNKHTYAEFYRDQTAACASKLEGICKNVSAFCKSFDHRFADKPLGDAQRAIEDAIDFLDGNINI
ncbi:MAG: DUF6062 family protein [Clostridia bacterium]